MWRTSLEIQQLIAMIVDDDEETIYCKKATSNESRKQRIASYIYLLEPWVSVSTQEKKE